MHTLQIQVHTASIPQEPLRLNRMGQDEILSLKVLGVITQASAKRCATYPASCSIVDHI